jgi:hypothetical protein
LTVGGGLVTVTPVDVHIDIVDASHIAPTLAAKALRGSASWTTRVDA